MKNPLNRISTFALLLLGMFSLFFLPGCASRPPSERETRWFDITTNVTPIVVVRTNLIPIWQTNYQTVEVVRTNVQPNLPPVIEHVTVTNEIRHVTFATNTITVTNLAESYDFKPGAGARAVQETGTAIGNLFGVGGMVGTGLGALFSLWASLRSRRSSFTAVNLAQTIETMREFIKSLPNGAVTDQALVSWMMAHQNDAAVIQQVTTLLQNEVSNSDAKEAARKIQEIIAALTAQAKPTT